MNGAELRKLRERQGWKRADIAEALNAALDRKYNAGSIGRWETGDKDLPEAVAALVETMALEANLAAAGAGPREPPPVGVGGDTAPSGPPGAELSPQPPLGGSGAWNRACVELWELVSTGVGMFGAVVGSQALIMDGAIIDADKEALGAAWGKLAETNATFRKMLVGMTEGGAWLQVALVTGTTASKCWQNHALQAGLPQANGHVEPVDDAAVAA